VDSWCPGATMVFQAMSIIKLVFMYTDSVSTINISIILAMENLNVLSLDCHGYNIGIESYLYRFRNDIILLQETWLSDCNAVKLNHFLIPLQFIIVLL